MNTMQAQSSITPLELEQLRRSQSVRLLDVRTSAEFHATRVSGAQLVPLDQLDPNAIHALCPNGEPLYILCQSGGRARKAIHKLNCAGINNCFLVDGGIDAWTRSGLPIERGESRVLPLMRQVQITVGLIAGTGAILALTVHPLFAIVPLFISCGLIFAGLTGVCGLALVLAKMPWNRVVNGASCCQPKKDYAYENRT